MHYRNGREAKNGDKIVKLEGGKVVSFGVLHSAVPGNDYCNGYIATIQAPTRERAPDGAANEPPPPAAKACERLSEPPEWRRACASCVPRPSRRPVSAAPNGATSGGYALSRRLIFSFSSKRTRYFIFRVSRSAKRRKISLSRTRISISSRSRRSARRSSKASCRVSPG